MSAPVLVLCNDFNLAAARTARHLSQALVRLGRQVSGRDTRLVRWAWPEAEKTTPARRDAFRDLVYDKWHKFVQDYGFDAVISLDLHWLFVSRLFVDSESVRSIHSFWRDDVDSSLKSAQALPLMPLELINQPKVNHHCPGPGPMEELRWLGSKQVRLSAPAAPADYLEARQPCTVHNRIAFTGDPGLPLPPSERALQALAKGENLAALRRLAREEILDGLSASEPTAAWLRDCPQVAEILAAATELRLGQPHAAAISLLVEAGKPHAEAFDFLIRSCAMLEAAALVKLVNRYDRPGLVLRLHRRGWLDVYGSPQQWAPYGIAAQPSVPFSRLASLYRKYAVHLNIAPCMHDAALSEELFEIAACGRLSLNLDSPDIRACYAETEVALAGSEDALEAAAQRALHDADATLAAGEKARQRTAREHLWDHRLKVALA
jgi:hypothetical protein